METKKWFYCFITYFVRTSGFIILRDLRAFASSSWVMGLSNSSIALCWKRDICYSEKTSTLEFFFTYLEKKIYMKYISHERWWFEVLVLFFSKFFFSYFFENFEAENNFWSQHFRRLQLIYLFFYSLDYYLSRKIGHRNCCVRKI